MGVTDFIVQYDQDAKKMGEEVIRHLTVNRLQYNKPVIILLTGDSGDGKSFTALKIMKIINDYYGVETLPNLDNQIVYTPLEYTKKMDAILHDTDKKKLKCLIIDEAREIVSSKLWYSFINRAIADVNALHRTIKPLVLIVVVQFIKDIDVSTRRTVNYYFKCARPLNMNVNLYPFKLWKDDRNLESPRIRKRSLRGYYRKDHRQIPLRLKKFTITMPPKDIATAYDKINKERKSAIIRRKLDSLVEQMEKELGMDEDRVGKLIEFYMKDERKRKGIIEYTYHKVRLAKDFKELHGLTRNDIADFKRRIKPLLEEEWQDAQ
jgi:hypothetical protein